MADNGIPHFHNDRGIAAIRVGAKEFMCIGATPPLDHPHIFLDMGKDSEIICPYCSTVYKFDAKLKAGEADPADAVFTGSITAAVV
jgi:Uncharacterized protein conserved in bacteria